MSEHHKPGHAVHETAPLNDPPDAWHDHSHDAEMPQQPHAEVGNAGMIMGVGLLAFLLVVVSVIAIYGYYIHFTTDRLNSLERNEGRTTGHKVWEEKIKHRDTEMTQYMWADHNRVQVPLELGVAKVIEEYAQRPKPQPAPATPRR